ncbi:MAG: 23S rRNA (guanosine(2251)-2'-O)-methyltransferase RlmB [Mogibacterium sp.]|nr:23S rRNA (guanosine(2251)-2'-O)-methyltransferase RlmB [Mogibacterium sp.]
MSKRDNKRYSDKGRKTVPKRGGKNRRDYGEGYEPARKSSGRHKSSGEAFGTRTSGERKPAGKSLSAKTVGARKPLGKAQVAKTAGARRGGRKNLDYSEKEALLADFGFSENEHIIGNDGLEVVAGRNPVTEVLKGEREVDRVFIADGAEGSVSKIVALARERGIIVDFVPKERIDAMAPDVKHQGVAAKVSEYKYSEIEDIFARAEESGEDPLIILLDEITDPHNLGAIIRTAECVGAHGVIVPKRRSASLTQTVALSAAGAVETIPVVQVTNLARAIDELKERGVWVAAADMDGETYYEANLSGSIALVIGSEGKGVGRLVKEKCDLVLSIPMYGSINSLNASNAAAVILYGIRRKRAEGAY